MNEPQNQLSFKCISLTLTKQHLNIPYLHPTSSPEHIPTHLSDSPHLPISLTLPHLLHISLFLPRQLTPTLNYLHTFLNLSSPLPRLPFHLPCLYLNTIASSLSPVSLHQPSSGYITYSTIFYFTCVGNFYTVFQLRKQV